MKNIILGFFLLWYFGMQSMYDPAFPKVTISTVIGPFDTQIECNRERLEFKKFLDTVDSGTVILSECKSIEKS